MSGYQVNHAELTDAATQTDGKAKDAESIRQKVTSADNSVPSQAWGLLGDLTVYHWYQSVYSTFNDHVNKMISGVNTLATDIKNTADQYKQNDDAVGDQFKDIENDLAGEPATKTAPSGGTAV